MQIGVVGAGLAGLTAAETLQQAGHEVVVFEARDRVGGRVWSQQLANGAWVERGAEFIEYDQSVIRHLACRLEVELVPTTMSYSHRRPVGGPVVTDTELAAAATALTRAATTGEWDGHSVQAVLDHVPMSAGARHAIAARIQVSFAQPIDALDATVLTHDAASFTGQQALRARLGNQHLATRLADRLNDRVHLATPVTALDWSEQGVRIHTQVGDTHVDACILAIPASIWRRITFTPALPDWKAAALDRVAYGHAAKLAVTLAKPAPPGATLSIPHFYWTWIATRGHPRPDPVLNCFAGSTTALTSLKLSTGPATWLEQLRALHPNLALGDQHTLLSTWDDDPWAQAAYSTRTPGHPSDSVALQSSVGPLYFAGEHTAAAHFALMEGAVRSGQRAARETLRSQPAAAHS